MEVVCKQTYGAFSEVKWDEVRWDGMVSSGLCHAASNMF